MSRSTFRKRAEEVAWQRQTRDRYANEGTPPVPHLNVKGARVRPVSRRLAEKVILKYEWLGTMSSTTYHYGIFFGNYCAGVCCVGAYCTAGSEVHKQFGIARSELLTLARGACVHWAPKGTNSKLISLTCRLLQREGVGKLIVAYSDPDAGEIGTVYQASNWSYIGPSSSPNEWVAPNGRTYNHWQPAGYAKRFGGTWAIWARKMRESGWHEQPSSPKGRYVKVLNSKDSALVDLIETMSKPYPKRACAGSVEGDAATSQVDEGGSIPTPAL